MTEKDTLNIEQIFNAAFNETTKKIGVEGELTAQFEASANSFFTSDETLILTDSFVGLAFGFDSDGISIENPDPDRRLDYSFDSGATVQFVRAGTAYEYGPGGQKRAGISLRSSGAGTGSHIFQVRAF